MNLWPKCGPHLQFSYGAHLALTQGESGFLNSATGPLFIGQIQINLPYAHLTWVMSRPEDLTSASPYMGQMSGVLWTKSGPNTFTIRSPYMGHVWANGGPLVPITTIVKESESLQSTKPL